MKNIVWDFDGTIANSYPGMVIAVKESLKNNFDIELSRDTIYKDIKETSIRKYVNELFSDDDHYSQDVAKNVKIFYEDYKLIERKYQDRIQLLPHALQALKYLSEAGDRQFIITHRDESIHEIAKNLEISQFFEEIVSVADNFERKPDSNMLDYLMEKYQLDSDDIYVIGDRKIDIDFGHSINAHTILLDEIGGDYSQEYTIGSLAEIKNII